MKLLSVLYYDSRYLVVEYMNNVDGNNTCILTLCIDGTYTGNNLAGDSYWKIEEGRFKFKHSTMESFQYDNVATPSENAEFFAVLTNWLTEIGLLSHGV